MAGPVVHPAFSRQAGRLPLEARWHARDHLQGSHLTPTTRQIETSLPRAAGLPGSRDAAWDHLPQARVDLGEG